MKHSMRLSLPDLMPWVIMTKSSTLVSAHYTCMAGLDEVCSHIAAQKFHCEGLTEKNTNKSVTDEFAYWMKPSNNKNILPKKYGHSTSFLFSKH